MDQIEVTRYFEILTIIAFIIMLVAALFMFTTFYICDSHKCKAFDLANVKAPENTKENISAILFELYNDGIWPIPYIGSAILTPLLLWLLSLPITVKTFGLIFFINFVVFYFMFSFFGHHYLRPISNYVSSYIETSCINNNNVTFATPIDDQSTVCINNSTDIQI